MNRKEKIELLSQIEQGNKAALSSLTPGIVIIFKEGETYKELNPVKGAPDKFYTHKEIEKLKANFDYKNKVLIIYNPETHEQI